MIYQMVISLQTVPITMFGLTAHTPIFGGLAFESALETADSSCESANSYADTPVGM